MKERTLGTKIAALRKERGMTQADLAKKMNVTDKAVSKWERDLSCPDVGSLPRLAEALEISLDELMCLERMEKPSGVEVQKTILLVCKAVTLAMGVAVAALSALGRLDTQSAFGLLGIGLACAGIVLLADK